MLGNKLFYYILVIDLTESFQLAVFFGLLDLLLDRNQVVYPPCLPVQLLRKQRLHVNQSVFDELGILLNILIHFESFPNSVHLRRLQLLLDKLLEQVRQLLTSALVLALDELVREKLPLLLVSLTRDRVEKVHRLILKNFLVQRAIGRPTELGVFEALGVQTGRTLS